MRTKWNIHFSVNLFIVVFLGTLTSTADVVISDRSPVHERMCFSNILRSLTKPLQSNELPYCGNHSMQPCENSFHGHYGFFIREKIQDVKLYTLYCRTSCYVEKSYVVSNIQNVVSIQQMTFTITTRHFLLLCAMDHSVH